MAVEDVLILTAFDIPPVVIANDDDALAGQVLLGFVTDHPEIPEFTVNVKVGTRETP